MKKVAITDKILGKTVWTGHAWFKSRVYYTDVYKNSRGKYCGKLKIIFWGSKEIITVEKNKELPTSVMASVFIGKLPNEVTIVKVTREKVPIDKFLEVYER